ncbi:MAG TPA: hypothetical protein VGU46_01190 [Acidobacteriaceae bacterium]|nr:hypothetical protein [Acidobacteriaceae bacterium]
MEELRVNRIKAGRCVAIDAVSLLCFFTLSLSFALAWVPSWHWPLMGDAGLIRYVVFLIHSGKSPYSQILDINLPGSYFIEAAAMKLFGGYAAGLRIYDSILCLVACSCMAALGGPSRRGRIAGLAAGFAFSLFHLQDGIAQAGQRDLAMCVIVLLAYVVLARSPCLSRLASVASYELLIGATVTIKPTLLPLAFLPLVVWLGEGKKVSRPGIIKMFAIAAASLLVPVGAVLLWLCREGSLHFFVSMLQTIEIQHDETGRRTVAYLLAHVSSPIIVPLIAWICLLFLTRVPRDLDEWLFSCGAFCGLLSYIGQSKGYPYQRYTFLAFVLLLIFREVSALPLRTQVKSGPAGIAVDALALIAVAGICLCLAPHAVMQVLRYDHVDAFQKTLAADLQLVGAQSSEVQCFDTWGGCLRTLYDLNLVQATGYLYDCYFYTSPGWRRDAYRNGFLSSFDSSAPRILILTDQFCFNGQRNFDRVREWPELQSRIDRDYFLAKEWDSPREYRVWARSERPIAYRVYVRRK